VTGTDRLTERFEENRPRLRAVAYRMLGSLAEADDAVQEAWLRLDRTDTEGVDNLDAWLTTVVGRICLDMLRSRASRREQPLEGAKVEPPIGTQPVEAPATGEGDPEQEALLADSVGLALLVVLDTLTPVERLAFVLHDMFGVSFEEISPIVGRSPAAARQIASRARRRVRAGGAPDAEPDADVSRQRAIVDAFLAASRAGEFGTLLTLLDPDVVLRADAVAARMGGSGEVRGSAAVAAFFSGRAAGAVPALLDGVVGAVAKANGEVRVALDFIVTGGRIVEIGAIADPERLREMELTVLP
jgi:RNA polymerase sigma-70 factor (ECF subfamily)